MVPFNHDCIVRVGEDGTVEGDLHVGLESKYATVREGSEVRRTVQSLGGRELCVYRTIGASGCEGLGHVHCI